ncbi:hypothetical protein ACX0G9_00265 [Flavitalea flava]
MTALWNDSVIGLSFFLLIFLARKEWRRPNRLRLPARLACTGLAVISLACMTIPISITAKADLSQAGKEGLLLTEGFDPDSLQSFMQEKKDRDILLYPGFEELRYRFGSSGGNAGLKSLHVMGFGLKKEEWNLLSKQSAWPPHGLSFHPPAPATGIVAVSWKQQLLPGEQLRIQGMIGLAGRTLKSLKLILTGAHVQPDSIVFASSALDSSIVFEINTVPAHRGRAVYGLALISGSDTLEKETIPVEVIPGKPERILFLNSVPGFENTFLANWLFQNHHSIAMRTSISKEKVERTFLNRTQISLDRLSPQLLVNFDIVIADEEALNDLSSAERSFLRKQIAEKGMGLIIRADSTMTGRDSARGFLIRTTNGSRPLMRDSLSGIVVSSSLYGSGKIISSTLTHTYSYRLSGANKDYSATWSKILQQASKGLSTGREWKILPAIPQVDEPVRVLLRTAKDEQPQGAFAGEGRMDPLTAVYLQQDRWFPFLWSGNYWPRQAGWQLARMPEGDSCWWYAWDQKDWQGLKREQRRKETLECIASKEENGRGKTVSAPSARIGSDSEGSGLNGSGQNGSRPERQIPLARAWLYILFLFSCIFLWVEKKL